MRTFVVHIFIYLFSNFPKNPRSASSDNFDAAMEEAGNDYCDPLAVVNDDNFNILNELENTDYYSCDKISERKRHEKKI